MNGRFLALAATEIMGHDVTIIGASAGDWRSDPPVADEDRQKVEDRAAEIEASEQPTVEAAEAARLGAMFDALVAAGQMTSEARAALPF